jgi:hypothetical protein
MKGIYNQNGVAAVIDPSPKRIQELVSEGKTESEAITQLIQSAEPTAIEVQDSAIPTERKWRKAWFFDGDVKADAENARQVALARLRILRDAEMIEADKNYTRADGRGNQPDKVAAEARRESLRGATDGLKDWVAPSPIMSLTAIEAELAPLEVLP